MPKMYGEVTCLRVRVLKKESLTRAAGEGVMLKKVLIVEDHALVRAGLRAVLETFEISEAVDAHSAYRLAEVVKPDLALVDVALPAEDGIACTRELKRRLPELRILVLSSYSREDLVVNALEAGAT